MLIKKPADIRPSEITGQNLYGNRLAIHAAQNAARMRHSKAG